MYRFTGYTGGHGVHGDTIKFFVAEPPTIGRSVGVAKRKEGRKIMKNIHDPFSVDDFSLLPKSLYLILFCNKTYFLHINSKPLTRFIVCTYLYYTSIYIRQNSRISPFRRVGRSEWRTLFLLRLVFSPIRNVRDDQNESSVVIYYNINIIIFTR